MIRHIKLSERSKIMYKIMAVEVENRKGQKKPIGDPFCFETYNDLFNATENMHYLLLSFGKHYNFYILSPKEISL